MGREAVCTCDWAGAVTEVKALLETGELILRGGLKKRLAFTAMTGVRALDGELRFTVGAEKVELALGPGVAAKWAEVISTPPPSLSSKLGISAETTVRLIGVTDSLELMAVLGEAKISFSATPDMVLACVDSPEALHDAVDQLDTVVKKNVTVWMVYAKGPGHAIDETAIRSLLRANGWMDTKVASVSKTLTALRFSRTVSR